MGGVMNHENMLSEQLILGQISVVRSVKSWCFER